MERTLPHEGLHHARHALLERNRGRGLPPQGVRALRPADRRALAAHGAAWRATRRRRVVLSALRPGDRRGAARPYRPRIPDGSRHAARHRPVEHLEQGRVSDARAARRAVGGAAAGDARGNAQPQAGGRGGRVRRRRPCAGADERGADPRGEGLSAAVKALLALLVFSVHAAEPLPALHAARDGVTASGVSSGGYMAVQLHVAHSTSVAGVGVIAGGPYYCAQGSLFTALYNCMTPGFWTPVTRPALLKSEADLLASSGRIDATTHLSRSRAWVFSGRNDRTVYPQVVEALRDFYGAYKAQVLLVADKPAGHGMVTAHHGNACGATEPPFIVDCDYDAAGELLNFLYGKLAAPAVEEG